MKVLHTFDSLAEECPHVHAAGAVLTVGSFDGVHLGHRYLLNELIQWARAERAPSALITFKEHPRTYMTGEEIKRITSLDQKLALFEEIGIDVSLVIDFNSELKDTSARQFCEDFLRAKVNARGLLLGHNNRIGRGREGSPAAIAEFAPSIDLNLRLSEGVQVGGKPISSSAIRAHIEEGDFAWAAKMLGRPYSIVGSVEQGDQLGRTIGFPTANISLAGLVHPPLGVYGVRVKYLGRELLGAANIGVRPTVDKDAVAPRLEVHLFDFDEDIYGQRLDVRFAFHTRPEQKFAGIDALQAQLEADCAQIRQRFAAPWEEG